MTANKTQPNDMPVEAFIEAIDHPRKRSEAETLTQIYQSITNAPPVMWGESIIGFGRYRYQRADGSKHIFMRAGFSPRKAAHSLYILPGYTDHSELLNRLGKYKKGRACLYINKLSDVDIAVLQALINAGWKEMAERYPE